MDLKSPSIHRCLPITKAIYMPYVKLFYDFNPRRLEEKRCVFGRKKSIIREYSLHIFQGMYAHIIVQPDPQFLT
jgi:hypothetical protein